MKADQVLNLKVVETARGTEMGKVNGLIIDNDERRVVAVAIAPVKFLTSPKYVPFENIVSVDNDVLTIPSEQSAVGRGNFRASGLIDSLTGKHVLTEDGRDLGEVMNYTFDPKSGALQSLIFGVSRHGFSGLWKTAETFEVPVGYVKTLGNNVIVDNSVPDIVGLQRAA